MFQMLNSMHNQSTVQSHSNLIEQFPSPIPSEMAHFAWLKSLISNAALVGEAGWIGQYYSKMWPSYNIYLLTNMRRYVLRSPKSHQPNNS